LDKSTPASTSLKNLFGFPAVIFIKFLQILSNYLVERMCNAHNHPYYCTCGFGGEGHLGRRSSTNTEATYHGSTIPHYPILNRLADLRSGFSFTIPNAICPVCGAKVFFYQNDYGSRVYFDDLGKPWPKHPCTDSTARLPRTNRMLKNNLHSGKSDSPLTKTTNIDDLKGTFQWEVFKELAKQNDGQDSDSDSIEENKYIPVQIHRIKKLDYDVLFLLIVNNNLQQFLIKDFYRKSLKINKKRNLLFMEIINDKEVALDVFDPNGDYIYSLGGR
jgi:hypothetical protein